MKQLLLILLFIVVSAGAKADSYIPSTDDNKDIHVVESVIIMYSDETALDATILYSYRCELIFQEEKYCVNYKIYHNWELSEVEAFRKRYGQSAKPIVFESHSKKILPAPPVYY